MKKLLSILICLGLSIVIVLFLPSMRQTFGSFSFSSGNNDIGMFHQSAEKITGTPRTVYRLYEKGELIGVLSDRSRLDRHLQEVYSTRYKETFPGSAVHLGKDCYLREEESFFDYSDAEEEIFRYLDEKELYALEATAVSFFRDDQVYARIYVLNDEIYRNAMNTYLSYFIDPATLTLLQNGEKAPELTALNDSRDTGITIQETITVARDYVAAEEIRTTEEEVLNFLEYGDNPQLEYYTVQMYDTVAGVGAKNHGLSATQVMNLNRDKIQNTEQVLTEGEQLCVTYFTSPINIVVLKESLREAPIYYETSYVEDNTILKGESEVRQEGYNGARNVLYAERWVNGVLMNGTERSSVDTKQPQTEVIAIGTKELPNVGTGDFRFPTDNPAITCMWGCYYNHRGTDIINQYNRWGDVLAADNGTVKEVGYNSLGGNYIRVDHNNGLVSYYGHMRAKSTLPIGTTVQKGDVLGKIGMTGRATGPHVHFYIEENGERRDACKGFLACNTVPHR